MLDLKPQTRSLMQARRSIKVNSERREFIETIVSQIYTCAVQAADNQDKKNYTYLCNNDNLNQYITQIITELRRLFPDCTVKYTKQIQDIKGTFHDESTLHDSIRPFLTMITQETISIDWA